jgi:hypothetical protein
MSAVKRTCCICEMDSDWVRVRMPNKEQMSYLCHNHYQSLQQRNPTLAAYYDRVDPMDPAQQQASPLQNIGPETGKNPARYAPQSQRDFQP